jgi:hypothetical protein
MSAAASSAAISGVTVITCAEMEDSLACARMHATYHLQMHCRLQARALRARACPGLYHLEMHCACISTCSTLICMQVLPGLLGEQ